KIGATTLLVAQSGGPTVVINASLAGVIEAARGSTEIGRILGARRGVEGILTDDFVDLSELDDDRLERLRRTPSAALGTSRHRQSDAEVEQTLDCLQERNITIFTPIGGNDTAETASRLASRAQARGQDLRIVAIPKTIDNDLPEMDHCPGYGSIARFIALAVRDATLDTLAMQQLYPVKIIEVMGRNAGWLAAAGSLAFDVQPELPRPVLCLPERPFESIEQLTALVTERIARDGFVVLVVPETMKWAGGQSAAGATPDWIDPFGHKYFSGVGNALARELSARLGVRARYDKPGTIARMAMHAASELDLIEAAETGREAVRRALAGETGVMVTINRRADTPYYHVEYGTTPLERIASVERLLDDDMIDATGHDVTSRFSDWARPLVGAPLPVYEVLS
ncbi:MAG TPA: diphosphate--fructose-6-phosphate 1-phosphotransferase, partial [Thermomicrobiales bacterium]|nr:diphosphate--fructose-6-phosphate 1-phosphotransferase [Thermomicrobiales bacterium]